MTGYYDVVLGLIPLALAGITAVLVAVGFPLTQAVLAGGSASLGLMGHALFVRAPVDAPASVTDAPSQAPARDTPYNAAD